MQGKKLDQFIKNERHDFAKANLEPKNLAENPLHQLKQWIQEAIDSGAPEPYAMNLATCVDNKPSLRVVYVREFYKEGLVFYTNYDSQKGKELTENPYAVMNFFWPETERQVRVAGIVEKVPAEMSDAYFAARPDLSKIGAWASEQSNELKDRSALEKRITELNDKFANQEIPRPSFWGGYVLLPNEYEFWQGRKNRLHDRVNYIQVSGAWIKKRLYP
ncbi:MAG: pyridoxamine 5'-phosphate oxidase [Flavobacteriales bacterium]